MVDLGVLALNAEELPLRSGWTTPPRRWKVERTCFSPKRWTLGLVVHGLVRASRQRGQRSEQQRLVELLPNCCKAPRLFQPLNQSTHWV